MYKDKPYNYPFSRRRKSKRLIAALVVLGVIAWWYIWARPASIKDASGSTRWRPGTGSSKGNPGAVRDKGQKFWTNRRQDVVKAMEKSWAGYEKYAWGKNGSILIFGPTNS
jgi:hypothetical protein